jgi:hypothetical protein
MCSTGLGSRSTQSEWWQRLTLAALTLAYAVYVAQAVATRGLFEYVGIDYQTFRASGEIARTSGFAQIYDLAAQAQYQQPLRDQYSFGRWRIPFVQAPAPYLPVFVLPFLILPSFAPIPGLVFWTLLSAGILVIYLRQLLSAAGDEWRVSLPFELTLALPVFLTLLFGQINVWLLVFTGQFLLANARGRELRSGLWLGGLLLKPQTLILFLPGLLISRRFKVLAGWAISLLVILAISAALAGMQGLQNLVQLVRLYPGNLPTTFPDSMMNWRALTLNRALFLSSSVAWKLGMAGLAMSLVLGLALWLAPAPPASGRFALVVLGTWAATAGVAWHSHVHMALPMLAPLLYLALRQEVPRWLVHVWILGPSVLFLEEAFRVSPGQAHVLAGLAMLAVNSLVLGWVTRVLWSGGSAENADVGGSATDSRPLQPTVATTIQYRSMQNRYVPHALTATLNVIKTAETAVRRPRIPRATSRIASGIRSKR